MGNDSNNGEVSSNLERWKVDETVIWNLWKPYRAEIPLPSKRGSPWEAKPILPSQHWESLGLRDNKRKLGLGSWFKKKKNFHVCTWDNLTPGFTSLQVQARKLLHKLTDKWRQDKKGSRCSNNLYRGKRADMPFICSANIFKKDTKRHLKFTFPKLSSPHSHQNSLSPEPSLPQLMKLQWLRPKCIISSSLLFLSHSIPSLSRNPVHSNFKIC